MFVLWDLAPCTCCMRGFAPIFILLGFPKLGDLTLLSLDAAGLQLSWVRPTTVGHIQEAWPTRGLCNLQGLQTTRKLTGISPKASLTSGLPPLWLYHQGISPACILTSHYGLKPSACCFRLCPMGLPPMPWPPDMDNPVLPPSWLKQCKLRLLLQQRPQITMLHL